MSSDGHGIVMRAFDTSRLLSPPVQSVVLSRCANGSPDSACASACHSLQQQSHFAIRSP